MHEKKLEDARGAWLGASRRLWIEQRGNGFPWLVTDFVTLGSPLARTRYWQPHARDRGNPKPRSRT